MDKIRDCRGKWVCSIDPFSGIVEHKYRKIRSTVYLPYNVPYILECNGTRTIVIRKSSGNYSVESAEL